MIDAWAANAILFVAVVACVVVLSMLIWRDWWDGVDCAGAEGPLEPPDDLADPELIWIAGGDLAAIGPDVDWREVTDE